METAPHEIWTSRGLDEHGGGGGGPHRRSCKCKRQRTLTRSCRATITLWPNALPFGLDQGIGTPYGHSMMLLCPLREPIPPPPGSKIWPDPPINTVHRCPVAEDRGILCAAISTGSSMEC